LELRHLRHFLAVAEYKSVAEAARHLHIVQPALSRQIKQLEAELGTSLFHRSVRGVELTLAGQQFAKDITRVLADLDASYNRVGDYARGGAGSLRIGVAPHIAWDPRILSRLQEFREQSPNVELIIESGLATAQVARVLSGELDGGFLAWRDPALEGLAGLDLFSCRLNLAVPSHSPYVSKLPEHLHELRSEPCLWFKREVAPFYYDFLIDSCEQAGLSPRLVFSGGDISTILGQIATGMGYSIVPDSARFHCPPNVVLLEHPDLVGAFPVEFVYAANTTNPVLARLLTMLKA
jgi:DNA-binding transcriptional LysR family regulator